MVTTQKSTTQSPFLQLVSQVDFATFVGYQLKVSVFSAIDDVLFQNFSHLRVNSSTLKENNSNQLLQPQHDESQFILERFLAYRHLPGFRWARKRVNYGAWRCVTYGVVDAKSTVPWIVFRPGSMNGSILCLVESKAWKFSDIDCVAAWRER